MIDPHGFELQSFNPLPHLVVPVVTDPQKAILALRWVVNEMEKRFHIFLRVGVTRIDSFNARPKANIPGSQEDDIILPEKLSHVVVVIENLEDLMQIAKSDMEAALDHLTQNGRAAGIHLVLTTRQPNQNTLSKSTKTEIPARIAFRCRSRIESRSVVGEAGAEKLLGKGDLLFLPPGSAKLIRAQGTFITDQEINIIVEFIAKQTKPNYDMESLWQPVHLPTRNRVVFRISVVLTQ